MIPLIAIGYLCALPGSLCSCPLISPDTARAHADVVFAGTVLRIDSLPPQRMPDGRSTFPGVIATFTVYVSWTGEPTGAVKVVTDGWGCGVRFVKGKSYMVYAKVTSSPEVRTELCMRTRELIQATDDIAQFGPGRRP